MLRTYRPETTCSARALRHSRSFRLTVVLTCALTLLGCAATPQVSDRLKAADNGSQPAISSRVLKTTAGERVLVQDVWLDAPVATVWKAYTTDKGWTEWAAAAASVDLRLGGTIRTHYVPGAKIGDPGTNTLHILNYVPEQLLTLQADLSTNWPAVLEKDAERLVNVIVFRAVSAERTHVKSYGIGYSDTPELDDLLQFFIKANEGLLVKLKAFVETS